MKRNILSLGAALLSLALAARADTAFKITGNDLMEYDKTAFDVKSGEKVTVALKNIGTLPKTTMAHNFVLLKKGTSPDAFATAGMANAAGDYISASQADKVLARTKMLGPGESDMITFIAPIEPGDYPFLCTYPVHAAVGMKGVMTVK